MIINRLLNSVVFWAAWIIIPVIMEIIPALGSVILLAKRHLKKKKTDAVIGYPEISLIVPVYNSQSTLYNCIKSIKDSSYPTEKIRVFLVNNQGRDDSFLEYARCQKDFPELSMQWLNAKQGKSKALNLALYNSSGKYIINLDSDGMLEVNALKNMVEKFERNPELNCMTGAILIVPEMIEAYKGFFSKLLRKLEFMEYAQAFLAGRSYASEVNGVYTLSGAFSAFRKSAVLKSQMYNTDTICEDTQITFQMKYFYDEKVEVCEDALYFVDPIEGVNKLYTQRQRWQRGSLEVAKMFSDKKFSLIRFFKDINIKTLVYDHTFAFPRMIWYLALLCLLFMNYSGKAIILATLFIILMYVVIGYFYFFSTRLFLKKSPDIRKYYTKQWWVVMLLPLFNTMVFFIRIAGIINSINTDSAWRSKDLKDERNEFVGVIKKDVNKVLDKVNVATDYINCEEKPAMKKDKGTRMPIAWHVCVSLLYIIAGLVIVVCKWVNDTYGVGLNELITTMTLTLKGTSSDVVNAALKTCLPPMIILLVVIIAFIVIDRLKCPDKLKNIKLGIQRIVATGSIVAVFAAVFYLNTSFDVLGYFKTSMANTKIYEDYYIDPNKVDIKLNGEKKNLIYIYIESLETTYASSADGGVQSENYIPYLTGLANSNISFSNTDKLGGFHSTFGTGVTMGALFGTTSGVPYTLTTEANEMLAQGKFMSGITTLGDILEDNGYRQMFLCGSDGEFGGRKTYFETHGNYQVFDLFAARKAGYVPDDYFVWWGIEDYKLYDIAKKELSNMASQEGPFNFTMLTVDPHHIDGYVCDKCANTYDNVTANVMKCSDNLLKEFIDWCKQQDFYEDSVIIITGDHPRMDTSLVAGVSYYDRTIYNCFINVPNSSGLKTRNRTFTPMDMFPTILGAMGFEIEGDRLGLGTNMFSDKKTLAEEKGFEWLDTEISKKSKYYNKVFIPELQK